MRETETQSGQSSSELALEFWYFCNSTRYVFERLSEVSKKSRQTTVYETSQIIWFHIVWNFAGGE